MAFPPYHVLLLIFFLFFLDPTRTFKSVIYSRIIFFYNCDVILFFLIQLGLSNALCTPYFYIGEIPAASKNEYTLLSNAHGL